MIFNQIRRIFFFFNYLYILNIKEISDLLAGFTNYNKNIVINVVSLGIFIPKCTN